MYQNKSLMKFFSSPGLCTKEELLEVENFLTDFKKSFNIYIESLFARNVEDVIFDVNNGTLESNLEQVKWYIAFENNKDHQK